MAPAPGYQSGLWAFVPVLSATLFSIVFIKARYDNFIPLLRLALKSSALGLVALLLLEPPDFTVALPEAARRGQYIHFTYFFALAASAVSLFRPSFIVPVAFYIFSTRYLTESITGLEASMLDIQYMLDMAIYLALFGIPTVTLGPHIHRYFLDRARQIEIAFVAFGLHLANYFWSGIVKLLIGPHWWTWILENRTFDLIPYALENGILPIGAWPWLVQFSYDTVKLLITPANFLIAGMQVLAIVVVLRMLIRFCTRTSTRSLRRMLLVIIWLLLQCAIDW